MPRKTRPPVRFADLCDIYIMAKLATMAERTLRVAKQVRDCPLGRETIGREGSLTGKKIAKWLTSEGTKKRWTAATRARVQTQIAAVLRWSVEAGLLDKKDKPELPDWPRVPKTMIVRYLSKGQTDTLLNECIKEDKHLYRLVVGLLYTGCRLGELTELKWGQVKVDTFEVVSRKGGNVMMRSVPIHQEVARMMAMEVDETSGRHGGMVPDEAKVFAGPSGEGWTRALLMRRWRKALAKSGLKTTFRELRHTFIHMMREKGIPLDVIAEIVGHTNMNTTARVYAPLNNEQKIKAVEKLEGIS